MGVAGAPPNDIGLPAAAPNMPPPLAPLPNELPPLGVAAAPNALTVVLGAPNSDVDDPNAAVVGALAAAPKGADALNAPAAGFVGAPNRLPPPPPPPPPPPGVAGVEIAAPNADLTGAPNAGVAPPNAAAPPNPAQNMCAHTSRDKQSTTLT
jgi:hypothetical protein